MAARATGLIGGGVLLLMVAVAVGAPLIAPQGYAQQNLAAGLKPPGWIDGGSWSHALGTDSLGRDILSRVVWSARVSLGIASLSTLISMSLGVLLGLVSGYYGGALDAMLMRIADVQLSFPFLVLAIAVMALLKPSLVVLVLLLALPGWVIYARTVRSQAMSLRRREFVQAAVAIGASHRRVILMHLIPNVIPSVIVLSSFQAGLIINIEATLSFLGVGVQPPTPSWGNMLSAGREYFSTAWWLGVFPGIAVTLTTLGANLVGDGLRDALDPRLKF